MFEFTLDQTRLFNCGIEFFSLCIVFIVYHNCKYHFSNSHDMGLFRRVQVLTMLLLVVDIVMWTINGMSDRIFWYLGYLISISYCIIEVSIMVTWLSYVFYRVYHRRMKKNVRIYLIMIPMIIICIFTLLTPWTKLVFYIDADNFYHRGVLIIPFVIILMSYIVAASVISLIRMKLEVFHDKRKEFQAMALFAVPPIAGSILQALDYGCAFLCPCIAFAILMVFIDMENRAVSQDALTGLNNRGNLDRYLDIIISSGNNRSITLVMMDINDFKVINDCYGHDIGDEVLNQLAGLLKKTFSKTTAFLARYGGDEFVVVIENSRNKGIESYLSKIDENLAAFNSTSDYEFELAISIGYAIYPSKDVDDLNSLLKMADMNMYDQKNKAKGVSEEKNDNGDI